jgi:hypothetical protein
MELASFELAQGVAAGLLGEFGMDGGGVDAVFEEFVDDAVGLGGGGGEDEGC